MVSRVKIRKPKYSTRDINGNYVTINTDGTTTTQKAEQTTSVKRIRYVQPVKRVAHSGYKLQRIPDGKGGTTVAETPINKALLQLRVDTRTAAEQERDQKYYDQKYKDLLADKATETFGNVAGSVFLTPSHLVGSLGRLLRGYNGYGSLMEPNKGVGEFTPNDQNGVGLANGVIDLFGPGLVGKTVHRLGKGIKFIKPTTLFNTLDDTGWLYQSPKTVTIEPSFKQKRLQLDSPTWLIYPGKLHSISEIINDNGDINLKNLIDIQNEALKVIPGGRLARHRLENQRWHKTDWNTFMHSRDAYKRALQADYPREALFPTLMHDAGKLWAGDGHGPYGASIIRQMFPEATDEQIAAIYQHMDKVPASPMGKLVKGADIAENNLFRDNIKNLTFQIRGEKVIGRKFSKLNNEWEDAAKYKTELGRYLTTHGYDISTMSLKDIIDLETARRASIIKNGASLNNRFGILSVDKDTYKDLVDLYKYDGSNIGYLSIDPDGVKLQNNLAKRTNWLTPILNYQGYWNTNSVPGVHMVKNLTSELENPEHGVSKDLYDIYLQIMKQKGNNNGLLSGYNLLLPEKTTRVTSDKNYKSITFPNTGIHHNEIYDNLENKFKRKAKPGESKILLYPLNPTVKFKSTAFDPSVIDENGNIMTDFNNSSMYYNYGKN